MTTDIQLSFARRVTRRHGEIFVGGWLRTAFDSGAMWDAFRDTELIAWPEGTDGDPRQDRYHDIEEEILYRTFATVREMLAETFVNISREVIEREQQRQRKASDGK